MTKIMTRYSLIICGLTIAFLNFIACGAKMYQVSLDRDTDDARIPDYAKDETSQYYGVHATDGWTGKLPIRFKVDHTLTETQLEGLNKAMDIWQQAVGQQLFLFEGADSKTGDSFSDLYGSLQDSVDGHYSDRNWDKTGKPMMVLATTIWDTNPENIDAIKTADIRYNTQYYLIGDAYKDVLADSDSREVVDMTTLAIHELGHLLGLSHVSKNADSLSIMNPTIYIGEGLANRYISCKDVKRIQQIYGCKGEACDVEKTCQKLGGEIIDVY